MSDTNETVSIRLPVAFVSHLRAVARQRSASEQRDMTYLDLIRQSLAAAFPVDSKPQPRQYTAQSRLARAEQRAAAVVKASQATELYNHGK